MKNTAPAQQTECASASTQQSSDISKTVEEEVQKSLQKIQADSTDASNKADYALATSGANVVSTRNTVDYDDGNKVTFMGWTLCQNAKSVRAMLLPDITPGSCWAFRGTTGSAVIRLVAPIYITGVTVDHIGRDIAPGGDVRSAPKEISIWVCKYSVQILLLFKFGFCRD